jgi:lysophospholipase L1-like esterase
VKHKYLIIGFVLVILLVLCFWYFKKDEIVKNYPSSGTDIVAFGDSLIQGVGATEGNDFISVLSSKIGEPIVNLGHSGDTTGDGLNRINEIDKYNPKVVILLLGGNDYLKKVPIDETRKNLASIIENIQSRGSIVLLLGVRGGIINDLYSDEFINLKNIYHTAYVSNILDGLLGNTSYMSDSVHPNNIGYGMIAERIYPVLLKIIK